MSGPAVLGCRELIREVPLASHVRDFASTIVMATHADWEGSPEISRRFVRYGASPRGAQALVLGAKVLALSQGRYNVSVEDIRGLAAPALRHRVILNFEGEAEAVDVDTLVAEIVEKAQARMTEGREAFLR
jgi:MoxR-like ATPase